MSITSVNSIVNKTIQTAASELEPNRFGIDSEGESLLATWVL